MNDQLILSIVIIGLLVFFISGKYRYDYVSLGALALLILFDVVKIENAFKEKEAYELQNKFLEELSIKNDMIDILNIKKCRSKQSN